MIAPPPFYQHVHRHSLSVAADRSNVCLVNNTWYFDEICQLSFEMCAAGASVVEGQKEHTLKLVRHVRRFFSKEAPVEIWAEFRPKMENLHSSEAMEV